MKQSSKREIGQLGEDIAAKYLENKGFLVLTRNYRKKWGELDLIVSKDRMLHFVEVKSVTRKIDSGKVARETYRAEENVHLQKLKRMYRAIETYLAEKNIEGDWVVDVMTVKIDTGNNKARCEFIENVF